MLVYELIQIAVNNRSELSVVPSEKDWTSIYLYSQKQSIVGICFYGVQQYISNLFDSKGTLDFDEQWLSEIRLPVELYYTWLSQVLLIQEEQDHNTRVSRDIWRQATMQNYSASIIKGSSLARHYGPLIQYRQSGDIDLWINSSPQECINWARTICPVLFYDYHHADIRLWQGVPIEVHYRPTISRNLIRNNRIQKYLISESECDFCENLGFAVPSYSVEIIIIINHIFWHLLFGGVGLKQVMDLYFVLVDNKNCQKDITPLLKWLKLRKISGALMWVLAETCNLNKEYFLCAPDEARGKFLLSEINHSGNMGKFSKKVCQCSHNKLSIFINSIFYSFRMVKHFPGEVIWNPIGMVYFSIWKRIRLK